MEKNWKKWKEDRKIDEKKHLERIEEKMEEENKKIRGRDWRTGHFSRGEILKGGVMSRSLMMDFIFIFSFYFILSFLFLFLFSFVFLEQLRLGFIGHAVTSVTS